MFRVLLTMTRPDLRFKIVTGLGKALRRTLPSNREKRKNEESDLHRQVARTHSSAFRVPNRRFEETLLRGMMLMMPTY